MKARSINYTVFEAAAEIVSPGTEVTIRDDIPWDTFGTEIVLFFPGWTFESAPPA